MRRRRGIVLLIVCLMAVSLPCALFAQDHTPQPYSPDEFQSWMKDLYRAEVILVGSLPITLFASLETYDLYRYFNNGLSAAYAPWPFNTGSTLNLTPQEETWIVVSAVGLSLTVAVIDFMLGRWNATSKKP
ncbi:MAG TPA: hypothetical protein VMU36_04980 [Spirochaetia bacterium]|nr:hypothetical protein [Spirochaetia bacterium]